MIMQVKIRYFCNFSLFLSVFVSTLGDLHFLPTELLVLLMVPILKVILLP